MIGSTQRLVLMLVLAIFICRAQASSTTNTDTGLQGMIEERDWLTRMSRVFTPEFWISYKGSLYFRAKSDGWAQFLQETRTAKSRYSVLTNAGETFGLVAKGIADSGVGERWQNMILVPRSNPESTARMFPKLDKSFSTIGRYKLLQSFEKGDALIQDANSTYYVYDLGRGVDDKYYWNAELIKEDLKTYTTVVGATKTVEAYTSVSLNDEERAIISKIASSFAVRAAELNGKIQLQLEQLKASSQFEYYKTNAVDKRPYMQYMLGRAYLEGKITQTNESLALEWLTKAAKNGSTDASNYLNQLAKRRGK